MLRAKQDVAEVGEEKLKYILSIMLLDTDAVDLQISPDMQAQSETDVGLSHFRASSSLPSVLL
jgi:hypothetical protein